MKNKLLFTVLGVLFIQACTLEKRIYRPGYYVNWNIHHQEKHKQIQPHATAKVLSKKSQTNADALTLFAPVPNEKQAGTAAVTKVKTSEAPENKLSTHLNPGYKASRNDRHRQILSRSKTSEVKKQHKNESGDGLIYLTTAMLALGSLGLSRKNRKAFTKLTRWAKANPKKTQGLIAALQLPLTGLALYAGYNLKQGGYELSNTLSSVFGLTTVLGFLSIPFLPKRTLISMPKVVNRHRMGYLGITLSSLMLVASLGNTIDQRYPDSPVAKILKTTDQSIFNPDIHQAQKSTDSADDLHSSGRSAINAGICVLAVFLIMILLCTLCAGICLAAFAVSAGGGVGPLFLGIFISVLSILGIYKAAKMCTSSAKTTG